MSSIVSLRDVSRLAGLIASCNFATVAFMVAELLKVGVDAEVLRTAIGEGVDSLTEVASNDQEIKGRLPELLSDLWSQIGDVLPEISAVEIA